ncbi:MAG: 2-oxoacid:acceptor oxidoreductase subunit alpha [Phycisphaerales bacterium]|nr:2-oxoacid:acceptor oxidoreductase subunit alpha [Phycisphaerales bacterium]
MPDSTTTPTNQPPIAVDDVAVRFAGDSGDGMQLAGGQFTATTALVGNDFATFPDYPAEIRAPRGTTFGVSGFQVHFSSNTIHTPGDVVDVLVAMNPAAFKTNIADVRPGGIVLADEDEFGKVGLKKAGYEPDVNPLDDEDLQRRYRIVPVPLSRIVREELADDDHGAKEVMRCRNIFALGLVCWLYDRPLEPTIDHLNETFGVKKGRQDIADLNIRALRAGWNFGETAELVGERYTVAPADLKPGTYRRISGNEAMVLGLTAAARKANKPMVYASYPITPASDVLHGMSGMKRFDVTTFQAEDEIAAVCAAIGASFAGSIGVTGTSGPGLALKGEAMGLAVMLELPLVILDVQRGGPATGMPTKPEQADLLQAMFGRSGEAPVIVLAAASPSDCFDTAIEAVRLATRHMCPVIVLSDAAIANGAEPWKLPDLEAIEPIEITHPTEPNDGEVFHPYMRDEHTGGRPWAIPGTPGLEHRVGGLEKEAVTGNVCYDGENHEAMVHARQAKIMAAQAVIPPIEVGGDTTSDTLILGWGGSRGAILEAADQLSAAGTPVAHAHLRHLNPFPADLGDVLARFDRVIVPETNSGQLRFLLRATYLCDAIGVNVMRGRSFQVQELVEGITRAMEGKS